MDLPALISGLVGRIRKAASTVVDDAEKAAHSQAGEILAKLAGDLQSVLPAAPREVALVVTKLEELGHAVHFAISTGAMNPAPVTATPPPAPTAPADTSSATSTVTTATQTSAGPAPDVVATTAPAAIASRMVS